MPAIDLFDAGAQRHPERACLVGTGFRRSYRAVRAATCRIANALARDGFAPGARAAVYSGNDADAFTCVLGLLRAGLVWLPINPHNAVEENARLLDAFDCDVLFVHSEFLDALAAIASAASRITHVICIDRDDARVPSLEAWTAGCADEFAARAIADDAWASISATSGTTGRPKGVMMAQRNLIAFSQGHAQLLTADNPIVYLAAAPLTHVAGRLCFPVLRAGGTIVVLARPDADAVLAAIPEYRVTRLFLPPTAIYKLLAQPNVHDIDCSSLKYFMYGAAPMSVDKLKEALAVFGPVMTQGYGQTEAPMLIAHLRPEDHYRDGVPGGAVADDDRLASCGKPTPFVRVGIMDEAGALLAPGAVGEIVVRGDIVMQGYYRDASATAEALRDGWLHTGDVGRIDPEGFLHIVDRRKDMIITGGFNVYSAEVEQVILGLPGVQDCAVIGVPDSTWGEAVKAVVQPLPGAALDAAAIIAACRPQLGGVKTPKTVEIWPDLPRSPAGKILKREIRQQFWAGRTRNV